jgi:predicted flap endonuclease-1-like 5' DNA nuclease
MVDSAKQSEESPVSSDGIDELPEVEAIDESLDDEVTAPGLGSARVSAPPPIPPEARQARTSAPPSMHGTHGEPGYAYRPLPPPPARAPGAPPSSGVYVIDPRALPPLPTRASSPGAIAVPAPRATLPGVLSDEVTQARFQPDVHRLEARVRELEAKLRLRDALITELERSLKDQRRRAAEADSELERLRAAGAGAEDLKRIHGVGKAFEQKLRSLGVTSYEQVAAWSASDVASIAEQLGIQPARIERDGWIESAKALIARR